MEHLKKDLPKGFGYVYEFIPGLRESLTYGTKDNLLGRVVAGYEDSSHAVLTFECIEALKKVQKDAMELGYEVLLYDGYRPKRAIEDFVHWADTESSAESQQHYYPNVTKSKFLVDEYIKDASTHCSGSAVDVTLIRRDHAIFDKTEWLYRIHNGYKVPYRYDGSIDMFTGYNLLDIISHHDTELIPEYALKHRNLLRTLMEKHSFSSSKNEWWHYVLKDEPFPGQEFDFLF